MISTLANLRLRNKFLMSHILVIAGLSCVALLVVRHTVQEHLREQVATDAHKSLVIFEMLHHQHQAILSRKADLLATLAFLSDNDTAEFKTSTENPLDSSGGDLVALADRDAKVLAIDSAHSSFRVASVEKLLRGTLKRQATSDWWVEDGRLYQVELQPIAADPALKNAQSGTVIVGQEIDYRNVHDLGRLLASELAFRYKGRIVASTLYPYQQEELAAQWKNSSTPNSIHIGGDRYFASSVDLTPGLADGPKLTVLKSDGETMAFLDRLNRLLVGLGLVAVLAGGCLVFVISDVFIEPLNRLVEGVHALERGDFHYRLHANGGDEVAKVTQAFDRMRQTLLTSAGDKQVLEEQLRQSQKMEALGRLAGGVAHDFNNLLTIIKGHSDLLLDAAKPGEPSYKSSQQINKAADRAASLTRQLLIFSRKQLLQPKVINLNALVTEMDSLLERLIREDIEYDFRRGASLGRIKADPGQIEQVLLNLVVNACDAMPQGGKLKLETRNVVVTTEYNRTRPGIEPGEYVLLAAADTGQGMDENTKARIFEPFFTTKEKGKGTGLGLATVYGVVKQSGGFIWVDSAPGKGTRFEIYFPQVQEQEEMTFPQQIEGPPVRKGTTVMVVEDEAPVRELTCAFLRSAGYNVLTAQDGMEALEIAKRMGKSLDGLVTDVVMPKMRGPELAARLKLVAPGLKVVYMSGYLEHNDESQELLRHDLFIQKPFTRDTLVTRVGEAMRPEWSTRN